MLFDPSTLGFKEKTEISYTTQVTGTVSLTGYDHQDTGISYISQVTGNQYYRIKTCLACCAVLKSQNSFQFMEMN